MSAPFYPEDRDDCWNCGGEGYTYDCFDGCCIDAESGCDDCARRCSVCRPRPPPADLGAVLGEALAKWIAPPATPAPQSPEGLPAMIARDEP